ncbi:MAG: hypothetical protein FWE16_04905 [Firmicutes bacterium]|nr:hypothetical protein [Bacillota bacterium]
MDKLKTQLDLSQLEPWEQEVYLSAYINYLGCDHEMINTRTKEWTRFETALDDRDAARDRLKDIGKEFTDVYGEKVLDRD